MELKKRSAKPFELLINTHHHGDHTAGNISFKGIVKHVLAHANSKTNQENSAKQNKNEDKQLYPDQTYTDTWCQKFGKEKICMYYYGAGHTNGDSFIHFEHANIVHCGDLVFNRRHPFVDRGAGANMKSWIDVLGKAVAKFDSKTTYIYGHSGTGYDVTGKVDDLKVREKNVVDVLAGVSDKLFHETLRFQHLENNCSCGCLNTQRAHHKSAYSETSQKMGFDSYSIIFYF